METSWIEAVGRCRFSARAVAGGAIVELVCFSVLGMLAGGVGLWRVLGFWTRPRWPAPVRCLPFGWGAL